MSLISLYTAADLLRVMERKTLSYDEVSDEVLLACGQMISRMWDATTPEGGKVFTFLLTLLLLGIEIGLNLPDKPNTRVTSEIYH